jgi:hypothetical protein
MPEHTDEEKELREIYAQELDDRGLHACARAVRERKELPGDHMLNTALAAMRRLSPAPQAGQTCQHKHTSVPRGWARSDGASETNWHCLDCGKQFTSKSEGREPDESFPLPQNGAPQAGQVTEDDMRAFGASDAACYKYPNEDQAKERAAYIAGAASRHKS